MKKKFKRIYIEITNCCNRSCSFCPKGVKEKRTMSLEEFEHILKEVSPYTDYLYLHVKGEPLLHPQFKEILHLCKKYNKKVNLTTNGTLLSKQVDTILSSNVVRQMNISLHHFKNEPNYINNILIATEKLLNHSPIYINYRFWTLENNQFTKEMYDILKNIFSYYQLDIHLLSKMDDQKNLTLKKNLYLSKGDLFDWPSLNHPFIGEHGTCHGTRDHLGILSDGTVIPCCLDSDGIISLGNIYKTSFSSILESDLYKKINSGFQNQKIECRLCQSCSYRTRFDRS